MWKHAHGARKLVAAVACLAVTVDRVFFVRKALLSLSVVLGDSLMSPCRMNRLAVVIGIDDYPAPQSSF